MGWGLGGGGGGLLKEFCGMMRTYSTAKRLLLICEAGRQVARQVELVDWLID